jgi:predicted Fe-Mo cluster-binding NifX family protein
MKIAVATEGREVAAHFGHCSEYTLVDVRDGQLAGQLLLPNPGHQPGVLPGYLAEKGVRVIIAGGMGGRAQQLFTDHGIRTVVGVSGPVDEIVRAYLAGTLVEGESLCDHDRPGHVKRCADGGCDG